MINSIKLLILRHPKVSGYRVSYGEALDMPLDLFTEMVTEVANAWAVYEAGKG